MTAELALYKMKEILEEDGNLQTTLSTVDGERSRSGRTPSPRSFKIGSFLGREEILSELPAITMEARSSTPEHSQEDYIEIEHQLWAWAFVAETDVEKLYLWTMRYGEALRRVLADRNLWGGGWHEVEVGNTMYTNVFSAGHQLVQGCRIEMRVREYIYE